MQASSTTNCRNELIAQRPLERARRLAAPRLLAGDRRGAPPASSATSPTSCRRGRSSVVNDTRVVPARIRDRGAARRGAAARARSAARSGRGSRGRRGGCAPGSATGRSSCSSISARAAGGCGSTASRRARRRCRRTSPSRSPTPSATRRSTRAAAGSAAAPTAGLHFTPELLARLDVERVTLHVGLDTFRPLSVDTLEEHPLHGERYEVRPEAPGSGSAPPSGCSRSGRRRCACSRRSPAARRSPAERTLFVTPGLRVPPRRRLLTNFHLPRSTLLALVMAFAGVEETRRLYRARGRGALPLLLLRRCDARSSERRVRFVDVSGDSRPAVPRAGRVWGLCRRTSAPAATRRA